MKMIEVINSKLEVMCVPPGKIPAGWTLYEDRRKFPRPEGTNRRPAALASLTEMGMPSPESNG